MGYRKRSWVFAVLALVLFLPATVWGQESGFIQIANEYIRIIVNTAEYNMGRFSVMTTGGDPDRIEDNNQHLIYGGENPWTSYTTVRIGNENWVFGSPTNRRAGQAGKYGEMVLPPTI